MSDAKPAPAAQPTDPRIGILLRKGKPVYYAFIGRREVQGTLVEVERALAAGA